MASSHRLRISQIESLTSEVVELYLGRALLPIGGDSPMLSVMDWFCGCVEDGLASVKCFRCGMKINRDGGEQPPGLQKRQIMVESEENAG
jgi:hypothetical protein